MSIDGCMGTEVNSALTLYDMIMSSGPNFCSCICWRKSWLLWT